MAAWHQGNYVPVNKSKCMNTKPITFKSGWEKRVMLVLDMNPSIVRWGSENIPINYYNPIKKRSCVYLPDLYVEIKDKKGQIHRYIYEIKPAKEAFASRAKSKYDKMSLLVNLCKWRACQEFCKKYGIVFKILTEEQLFKV